MVGSFIDNTTEESLKQDITAAKEVIDIVNKSMNSGTLTFETEDDAKAIIENLSNSNAVMSVIDTANSTGATNNLQSYAEELKNNMQETDVQKLTDAINSLSTESEDVEEQTKVEKNNINDTLTTYYYQGDCNTLKNSPNTLVTCQKSDSKTECICQDVEDAIYSVPEWNTNENTHDPVFKYKCTNPMTDANFCLSCINDQPSSHCKNDSTYACESGASCQDGNCIALSCASPLTQCNNLSKCVDLPAYHMDTCTTCLEHWIDGNNDLKDGCEINVLNDNKNCGKKDNECSNGSQCINGECVCTGSFVRADSCQSWIDQTTTTTSLSAPIAREVDKTRCIDSNALHFTYNNQAGSCTCHTNWLHEAGSEGCLINIKNDPYNCGALGNQCSTNVYDAIAVCTDGVCGLTCKTNHTKCNDGYDDYCVDLNSGLVFSSYNYGYSYNYIDFCGNCETTCYSPHDTCQSASCCRSSTNETNDEVVTCCNGLTRYRKWHNSWGGYYSYICRSQKPGGWETY
jgi:hypothetical protein